MRVFWPFFLSIYVAIGVPGQTAGGKGLPYVAQPVVEKPAPVAEWKGAKTFPEAAGIDEGRHAVLMASRGESGIELEPRPEVKDAAPPAAPVQAAEKRGPAKLSKPEGTSQGGKKRKRAGELELKERPAEEEKLPTGPSSVSSSAEAAGLISSAYQAVQRHELDEARRVLDEARALNHEQAWLWTTYGYAQLAKGSLPDAIDDFQRELILHPETYATYGSLARSQQALNERKEALATLEKWVQAQPDSLAPTTALVGMLLADDDFRGAVSAAETAAERLPQKVKADENFQFLQGDAQMKAGMKDKGHATLLALLNATSNPGLTNDSAYELADAGFELPLTDAKAKEAVAKKTEQTRGWTLEEDPQVLLAATLSLAASWDTLGWILFREGKLEEARGYVQAAAKNAQHADVLEHLGDIEAAQGRKDVAARDYELALATFPDFDLMGERVAPTAKQKALMAKIDKIWKKGPRPAMPMDAKDELVELRKLPLGPAGELNGTEHFRMLLRGGKVARADKIRNEEVPGGAEKVKQANVWAFWPADGEASLVRQGFLHCYNGLCELALEP